MKTSSARSVFILTAVIALAGCGEREPAHPLVSPDDTVLVEVGGEPVTLEMLEFLMEVRGVGEDDTEQMRQLMDELVRLQAVANRAQREGVSDRPKVRAARMLKDVETQYVQYLQEFQRENPVTDAEIRAAYESQADRAGGREYRLETIEFADQAAALALLDELSAGEVTFDAAMQRADAAGRTIRRTEWADGSQVPPDFRAVLAETGVGQVAPALLPFEQNWMVVRVADARAFEPPPLEELREGIRRTLMRERTEAMIQRTFEAADVVPMLPLEQSEAIDDP
jgi:peptidyl-prolyl cis-trans isomerase C